LWDVYPVENIAKKPMDFHQHNKIASGKYCKSSTTPEKGPNFKIDQCKEHCQSLNGDGSIKGYWWKTYRGGYCGCCKSLDNLASNWPDANMYSLEQAPVNLVDTQRWKIVYPDAEGPQQTKGFD